MSFAIDNRFGITALKDEITRKIGEPILVAGQKPIKIRESQRNAKRKALFETQDAAHHRRETLLAGIEAKLTQNTNSTTAVYFRWRTV